MRSNKYDSLPNTVEGLKSKIKKQNKGKDAFQKAESGDHDFSNVVSGFAASCIETNGFAKQVQEQFVALKKDFDSKVINVARYKIVLLPLFDLLTGMGEKIDVTGLDTASIAKELKRAGY